MKNKFIVIFVSCPSRKEAALLARSVLKKRLTACANIIDGVTSAFWWNGRIDRARETLLILKTEARLFSRVDKEVRRLHSYEVPEIIAIPVAAGSKDYLDWIDDSVVK